MKSSVSLQLLQGYQTLHPARTQLSVSIALAKPSSSLLTLFLLFFSHSRGCRVHRQFIFASHLMIAMATVGWGNFWINASIVHLLAFPRLRGGSCFYLAQRMKGRPRAAESGRRFSTFCRAGQIPQALRGGGAGSQVRQPTPPELLYPHIMAMIMS